MLWIESVLASRGEAVIPSLPPLVSGLKNDPDCPLLGCFRHPLCQIFPPRLGLLPFLAVLVLGPCWEPAQRTCPYILFPHVHSFCTSCRQLGLVVSGFFGDAGLRVPNSSLLYDLSFCSVHISFQSGSLAVFESCQSPLERLDLGQSVPYIGRSARARLKRRTLNSGF